MMEHQVADCGQHKDQAGRGPSSAARTSPLIPRHPSTVAVVTSYIWHAERLTPAYDSLIFTC